jgi:thioredoxin-related protein
VDQLNDEFAQKGLVILTVNVGESKKTVKKYLEQHPRKTRIVLTDDTNLAAMFAAKSYPIYVVIDRDGNIAGTQRGAAGEDALRVLLARGGMDGEDDDK